MTAEPYTPSELPGVIEYLLLMESDVTHSVPGMVAVPRLELHRLLATVEAMAADAERWQYARDNHLRAHSPHMNGTWGYAFRGMLNGLHRTPDDAIDAARKDKP